MAATLTTTFTGVRFKNPFLLSSAPPTESESNILRAFESGWGGVVTKTIGLHPVVNVVGPEMDRTYRGSNVGKDKELVSIVTKLVKEIARVPVWAKLTPSTTDIVLEARGAFLGGADAVVSSNTFTSLPLIDPDTLEFEVHVDGLVSTGGLGGPAILPLSLAKMSQLTQAFPDKSFSGIGGISTFAHALNYFLLGCGTVQVCTAAMLDHAVGPNVIRGLVSGMTEFMERRGFASLEDFRGARRDRVVPPAQIQRPGQVEYHGGYAEDEHE